MPEIVSVPKSVIGTRLSCAVRIYELCVIYANSEGSGESAYSLSLVN